MKISFLRYSLLALCSLGISHAVVATTYYVSATGDDTNLGTSASVAWHSVERVNRASLKPGDRVLFEAAQTFDGVLAPQTSGTQDHPIVYSSYGKGAATINSHDNWGFLGHNTEAIELRRLNFVGSGRATNTTGGVFFYRDDSNFAKQLQHLVLDSLDVSGYSSYGILIGSTNSSPDLGSNLYGYDNVRITNTAAHDNGDTGIYSYGATLRAHRNWYIGNCKAYNNSGISTISNRNTGSGIVLSSVDGALIEQCEAYNNGWLSAHQFSGPAGIWGYACNALIIQNCESHHNRSGTIDGGGFDLDGGCTNSTLQYNYSHDNEGPGLMMAQYSGAPVAMRNNTIRYNISENDARRYGASILLWSSGSSGGIHESAIYNNTVYLAPTAGGYAPQAVYIASTDIVNATFRNNIFQTTEGLPFLLDMGGTAVFQGNCYWSSGAPMKWRHSSTTYSSLEEWRTGTGAEQMKSGNTGLVADPLLFAPGKGGSAPWGPQKPVHAWKAYQLQPSSPLLGAGLDLRTLFDITPGTQDLYGFPIPTTGGSVNIGAQGGSDAGSPLPVELVRFQARRGATRVGLEWATATERNSASFEVQRSSDGKKFVALGHVAAAGTSTTGRSYTWDDLLPLAHTTYYRLRQTDLDGSVHYSAVAVVAPTAVATTAQPFSVFPNPVKQAQELRLDMTAWAGQPTRLTITSLTGQVALRTQLTAAASAVAVRLPAQLATGTYLVSIHNGQQEFHTRLVVE